MKTKSSKITCTKRGVFMTTDCKHWIGRRRVAEIDWSAVR
jgi:hypothetical protein